MKARLKDLIEEISDPQKNVWNSYWEARCLLRILVLDAITKKISRGIETNTDMEIESIQWKVISKDLHEMSNVVYESLDE